MRATYFVTGQIFFASVDRFTRSFQVDEAAPNILIDVSAAHFWDISGVGALDKIIVRLRREARAVEVVGYNRASADIIDKRSEEHTSELQSLMRISYAVFCLKK